MLGASALAVSAQTFSIVSGKVLETGMAPADDGGERALSTRTITVLIENSDRVFRIEKGTPVKYAISEEDAEHAQVGSRVTLLISSYTSKARVISSEGGPDI
ncbi:MAG: hypothetical protein MN733_07330 [Nitrososphaera sp.]|nr:hypothetical protein [Nitrososphaera sp.]